MVIGVTRRHRRSTPTSSAPGHLEIVADENFGAIGTRVNCVKGKKYGVIAHVKKWLPQRQTGSALVFINDLECRNDHAFYFSSNLPLFRHNWSYFFQAYHVFPNTTHIFPTIF